MQDQREMEQLERNICQMDATARGKLTKESLKWWDAKETFWRTNDDVKVLRKYSISKGKGAK